MMDTCRRHVRETPCTARLTLVAVIALALGAQAALGQDFAGGTGEPNDPYQIATAEQLISIGQDAGLQARHFILVADIDLDPNLPGGRVFEGALFSLSSGSLDGKGHKILSFHAYKGSPAARPALCDHIGPDAIINNVTLEKAFIRNGHATLVHENEGLLTNCVCEGVVLGASNVVGGLAGVNSGTVIGCRAACDVSGEDEAGGLVGTNSGTIRHCCATGNVESADGPAGGLVAINSGEISGCCAKADVFGSGLVAINDGAVSHCYAAGNASGSGLVGVNTGIITGCYAATGDTFVADNYIGTVINCYFLSASDAGASISFPLPLSDAQMRRRESFVGWDFWPDTADGPENIWVMPDDGGYPILKVLEAPSFAGSGTEADPYLIESNDQLYAIAHEPQVHYRLVADLDLQGRTFSSAIIPAFWGTFDGAGHSISHFTLEGERNLGLFGTLRPDATVARLSLQRVHVLITGEGQIYSERVGTLAVRNRGEVADCSAVVDITSIAGRARHIGGLIAANEGGQVLRCVALCSLAQPAFIPRGPSSVPLDYCGGLVGFNSGTIVECHASGYTNDRINGFGALVGHNYGSIVDCYADGHHGGRETGGLVGTNYGSIANCYSAAVATAHSDAGGLVGHGPEEGTIVSSYFLTEADGGGPDNGFGTALSDAQMKRQTSFIGWDFEDVWTICADQDYPRLKWEGAECDDQTQSPVARLQK